MPLSRKNKAELMEEYQQLLVQYDELKKTARLVSDPQNAAFIAKAEGYTINQLTQSISELKSNLNGTLNELADKLIAEAQKFEEIQKAIELAKKNLDIHYHIQVAAETLDTLINENKKKAIELEEEKIAKQRDWTREQEEREYAIKMQSRRTREEFEELKTQQNRVLKEREEALKSKEQEIKETQTRVEGFPAQLERALAQKDQEMSRYFKNESDKQLAGAKKDWEAQENLFKMEISNLEERLKTQNVENTALRKEIEQANRRIQELAVTIIESGARLTAKQEEKKEPTATVSALAA
ncbi:MAG: hypothetical protein HZC05_00235 [Candidatus Magasanikbacteria bacterium]|nr:hypothetical protein [Candidatus Magasanikbacteria bacterium]